MNIIIYFLRPFVAHIMIFISFLFSKQEIIVKNKFYSLKFLSFNTKRLQYFLKFFFN